MEDKLVEILEWLHESAQSGADFVAEQAPQAAVELIWYGRCVNTALLLLSVLAAVAIWRLQRGITRQIVAWAEDRNEGPKPLDGADTFFSTVVVPALGRLFGGLLIAIGPGMWGWLYVSPAIMAWVAPRVYLLDYIANTLGR